MKLDVFFWEGGVGGQQTEKCLRGGYGYFEEQHTFKCYLPLCKVQ